MQLRGEIPASNEHHHLDVTANAFKTYFFHEVISTQSVLIILSSRKVLAMHCGLFTVIIGSNLKKKLVSL